MRPALLSAVTLFGTLSCTAPELDEDVLRTALQSSPRLVTDADHQGPPVAPGDTGPARFVEALDETFRTQRIRQSIAFVDQFYRAPGSDGYEATLDRLRELLEADGFSPDGEIYRLMELEGPITSSSWVAGQRVESPSWNPRSARIAIERSNGDSRVLHSFDDESDRDRTMLPINAPSCDVRGPVKFHLEEVEEGDVLVIEAPLSRHLMRRARSLGAIALLSASYESFNVDPTGAERHLDFVQYRQLCYPLDLPVGQISPRSYRALQAAEEIDRDVEVSFQATVEWKERPLRTLVATIVGAERPDECVAISSHVNEPGAGDNASGVVGMQEAAHALAEAIRTGKLERPARSVVFIWGDEFRMTQAWLEADLRKTVVGISADMLGQSPNRTGAIALLERGPDPGAVRPLNPDVHTPWGAGEVDPESLVPDGLAVVGRCAMVDVGLHAGEWMTRDHPWEGGSDHDIYLASGIPSMLIWHFTDFTYHSNLDRMEMIDLDELRHSCVAVLATALAVADPQPTDLERYLASLDLEREVRVQAALGADDAELAESWQEWCTGARHWLRELCLGLDEEDR